MRIFPENLTSDANFLTLTSEAMVLNPKALWITQVYIYILIGVQSRWGVRGAKTHKRKRGFGRAGPPIIHFFLHFSTKSTISQKLKMVQKKLMN